MTATRAKSTLVPGIGVVAAGTLAANACSYLVHLPAGRWLSASEYGEFAVLLQAMLWLGVPALGLQAVVARQVVRGTGIGELYRIGAMVAAAVAVLGVVAVGPVMMVADTGLAATAAALVSAPLLVVVALAQGIVQGQQRFSTLAWLLAVVGVLRTAPVVAVLVAGAGPVGALIASAVGSAVAAALAVGVAGSWLGAGPLRTDVAAATSVLRASGVQLVLIAATSIDLLLARTVLGEHDAGVYALGTIATKAAFWLPQAIGVVLYPRLADAGQSAAAFGRAVRLLGVIGVVVIAGSVIGGPVVPLLVGDSYRPVAGWLWLFAITGCAGALLQLILLAAIAVDRTRVSVIAWAVVVVEVILIVTLADSVLSLALIAAGCVYAAALSCLLTQRRHYLRSPQNQSRDGR